uniref:Uncharacterized protein n=1 Tax=Pavo cristatus TaxID=9049 RepID=A0A8C9F1I3_PAVCR
MRNKLWLQSISFFLLFQYTTCHENLTCFVDYVQTLSCLLRNDLGASSYNITATWVDEDDPENTVAACSLLELSRNTNHTEYVCTVDMTELLADIKVQVDVTEIADRQHVISRGFYMRENIRPQPPFNLTAVFTEGFNISWETIYQNPLFYFLNEELEYQLRYKRKADTWETQKIKSVHEDKRTLVILPWELQGNTEYEFQVRARPREDTGYYGFWSEWSSRLTLKTSPAAVTQRAGMGWMLFFVVAMVITASITAFLAKQQSLWKRIACIPDPSAFFKPLYLMYNGDFKILPGMGRNVQRTGLHLCITAVLLLGEGQERVKLDPPLNIQSNITASKCQIWWTVPSYLDEILQYQLQYKEYSTSWETALNKTPPSSLPQIEIEGTEFRSGVSYTARVRCKVSEMEDSYHSQWSDWSQTTVFQREGASELSEKRFDTRTLQFLIIPLSFGTLLYLFWNCKLSSRAKVLSCLSIPTPAAFFQPLYNLHNGNFKDWVGPNEACSQLRREEASNSNKVTSDEVSELNVQELTSQISWKPMESTNLATAEEIFAFDSGPSQQYVPSRCARGEEREVRPAELTKPLSQCCCYHQQKKKR